jgi:hypothetical protein
MKIRLNLATSPLEGNRRFAAGAAAIAFFGLIAFFVLAARAYAVWRADTEFRTEESQIEGEMSRLLAERRELEQFFGRPETVQRRELAAFLNSLIAQRAFPWTRIFMDFERNLPPGVRIISIEPRLVENYVQLRLTIAALDDEGKLAFLRTIEDSQAFSRIEVQGERRADTGDIMVLLEARYSAT